MNNEMYDKSLETFEKDPNLDAVYDELLNIANNNDDIQAVRELSERAENYEPENPIRSDVATFNIDENSMPIYAAESTEDLKEASDIDLMNVKEIDEINEANLVSSINSKIKGESGLSDAEANAMLDAILTYRKDPKANVYSMRPMNMKTAINNICASNNIPITQRNAVAKTMLQEIIDEAKVDQEFVDIEKALDKAMRIPSLTDIYNDYTSETMDEKIPAMADAIQDSDPERAEMLREVNRRFNYAINYRELKDQFDNKASIRKAIRRDYLKWIKMAELVNFINQDTEFKMPDAKMLGGILSKVLLEEENTDIEEADVFKFLVLVFKGIDKYRDQTNILNAAYVYYLLKNIMMLNYTNDKAKGSFSVELISNIKTMIYYIRVREAEFNALNHKS